MGKLVLVRHGTSEYNKKGMWTGWDDPDLAPEGVEESHRAGLNLKDIHFNFAFTAAQKRSEQTFIAINEELKQKTLVPSANKNLNERNYGIYTRKNKWQVRDDVGEVEFQKIRRGWDHPIPQGESLKQVYEREVPFFEAEILPKLKAGENVIIVSSGNALRAIVKYLEHVTDNKISLLEIGLGEVYVYTINKKGKIITKEIRAINAKRGKI